MGDLRPGDRESGSAGLRGPPEQPMGSKGGAGNWGAGFLPSAYQATSFRSQGTPILNLNRPRPM